ncbi:MAG: hypothetical protein M3N21_04150 [Actinomycetota bacterium]|nr:hypothetical protein [Actinomycetota bacterium]
MNLRSLDQRYVPLWSAGLRRLVDDFHQRNHRARLHLSHVRAVVVLPHESGPLVALRRLDDRFARRGPLGFVRDVPQIGLLVALAVFVAGAGLALARSGGSARLPSPPFQVAPIVAASPLLGPPIGSTVDAYISRARQRAAAVSAQTPDGQYLALVSFAAYFTPTQIRVLMGPLLVRRAYLRSPRSGPNPEILPVPVMDLVPDLRKAYGALAVRKGVEQREFRKLAESIVVKTKEEAQFRSFYLAAAVTAGKEAAAYRAGCACVFEVVVSGPARILAGLPNLQGVRAVELAAMGAEASTLRVLPLLPEMKGLVKPTRSNGGGNGA